MFSNYDSVEGESSSAVVIIVGIYRWWYEMRHYKCVAMDIEGDIE